MSTVKSSGASKNLNDSNPKFLGTKLYDGEKAKIGSIIIRQRGTKILAGKNVRTGRDHTLFSMTTGTVKFGTTRKKGFNGKTVVKKTVSVISE
jgi:large subunit ribosomal protein L27